MRMSTGENSPFALPRLRFPVCLPALSPLAPAASRRSGGSCCGDSRPSARGGGGEENGKREQLAEGEAVEQETLFWIERRGLAPEPSLGRSVCETPSHLRAHPPLAPPGARANSPGTSGAACLRAGEDTDLTALPRPSEATDLRGDRPEPLGRPEAAVFGLGH